MDLDLEIPKSVMIYIMPSFDVFAAGFLFYSALRLTDDFGIGSWRQWLLLTHRILTFLASFFFAYHAYDLWRDPVRHGMTLSNFELHAALVALLFVASIRIMKAEKHRFGNGDGLHGPFGHR